MAAKLSLWSTPQLKALHHWPFTPIRARFGVYKVMTRAYHGNAREFSTYHRPNEIMAQPRSLAYRGTTRSYHDGNESDGSRSPRGDRKARKRNSVAVSSSRQFIQPDRVQKKADLR